MLKSLNTQTSKSPKGFDFDVHVDDLKEVGIEGEKWNFKKHHRYPRRCVGGKSKAVELEQLKMTVFLLIKKCFYILSSY